jgi:WD40 repeat protein
MALAVSPDGNVLAAAVVADKDRFVKTVDVKTGKDIRSMRHSDGGTLIAFSAKGEYMAADAGRGRAKLWDCTTWKEAATFENRWGIERPNPCV